MYKKFLILSALISLSACDSLASLGNPLMARNFPPPGPPNYQKGMVDGCKTAATASGAGRVIGLVYNKYYYDVNQGVNDRVYDTAWTDGFRYCKFQLFEPNLPS